MLVVTYWDDDTDELKAQREELLRQKKGLPAREVKPASPTEDVHLNQVLELLVQQISLTQTQTQQIEHLSASLEDQKKILQDVLSKEPTVQVVSVNPEVPAPKPIDDMPVLADLDVKVIKTDGIETRGQIGEEKKEGQSVSDKAAKLREIMKKGRQ